MTAREQLNRRHRPSVIALYSGFAVAFAFGLLSPFLEGSPFADYVWMPMAIGIVVTICSMLVIQFGIRCPFCKLRLGQLLLASGRVWKFGRNFNFCPKCGSSLDQEISS